MTVLRLLECTTERHRALFESACSPVTSTWPQVDLHYNIVVMKPPYYSKMHSGNFSIILEEGIDFDSFPDAAERWIQVLDLHVTQKVDGPDVRLWNCERNGKKFWLAYDSWFPTINLEPQNDEAGAEIQNIGSAIRARDEAG